MNEYYDIYSNLAENNLIGKKLVSDLNNAILNEYND